MKKFGLAVIGAALAFSAAPASATCSYSETLMNSGEETLVCIDTNKDGQIDPDEDCCMRGSVDSEEATTSATSGVPLCLNATQSDDMDQQEIVGCGDRTTYTGTAAPTSFVLTNQYGSGVPGFNGLAAEGSGGSSSATSSGGTIPQIVQVMLSIPSGGTIGQGQLCNAGGPAAQVMDNGGMTYVVRFTSLSSGGVDYECTLAPIPLAGGGIDTFRVCTPVNEAGNSVISTADGQLVDYAEIPFAGLLDPCAGGRMAPTVSELGLIVLALSLLGGGTWVLRRRGTFGAALPAA